jgi:hypothetical protein
MKFPFSGASAQFVIPNGTIIVIFFRLPNAIFAVEILSQCQSFSALNAVLCYKSIFQTAS